MYEISLDIGQSRTIFSRAEYLLDCYQGSIPKRCARLTTL